MFNILRNSWSRKSDLKTRAPLAVLLFTLVDFHWMSRSPTQCLGRPCAMHNLSTNMPLWSTSKRHCLCQVCQQIKRYGKY